MSVNAAGPYQIYQEAVLIGMTNACSNLCQEPIATNSMFVDACMELFNSTGEFLSWNLGKPKDPKPQCDGPHEHAPCASTARMGSHVGWFKNHISNPIIELALCAISAQSLRDIGFRGAFQCYWRLRTCGSFIDHTLLVMLALYSVLRDLH